MDVASLRPAYVKAHRAELDEVLAEQATVILSLWEQSGKADVFDRARWDAALRDRLQVRNKLTASDFGSLLAGELGTGFDPTELDPFLSSSAGLSAENINAATEAQFRAAVAAAKDEVDQAVASVFDGLLGGRLDQLSTSTVTTASNFGMHDAARQGGARTKQWVVHSGNPRSQHARVNGESVPLMTTFSNGMKWPGDPAGGADQVAGCQCSVTFEEVS